MPCIAKKNVEDERSGHHMNDMLHNTGFVTIELDDFYDYIKISFHHAISILHCQCFNLMRQIILFRST